MTTPLRMTIATLVAVVLCHAHSAKAIETKSLDEETAKELEKAKSMHPVVLETGSEETDYKLALAYLERETRGGKWPLDAREFRRMNWIGRTAIINYICSIQGAEPCRKFLGMGLKDDAMFVRDHALRVVLASPHYSVTEKQRASRDVLMDTRNYRHGNGLWIVERARGYLARK